MRLIEVYVKAAVSRIFLIVPLLLDLGWLRPEWRNEIRQPERRVVNLCADAAEAASILLWPRISVLHDRGGELGLFLVSSGWRYIGAQAPQHP